MIAKKLVVAATAVAILATSGLVGAPTSAKANDAAVAAGAFGLVGGMILGGALAQQNQDDRDVMVVRRRPARVYDDEEEVVVPRRCWREEWQDRWGDIHFRRVCR